MGDAFTPEVQRFVSSASTIEMRAAVSAASSLVDDERVNEPQPATSVVHVPTVTLDAVLPPDAQRQASNVTAPYHCCACVCSVWQ